MYVLIYLILRCGSGLDYTNLEAIRGQTDRPLRRLRATGVAGINTHATNNYPLPSAPYEYCCEKLDSGSRTSGCCPKPEIFDPIGRFLVDLGLD